MSKTIVGMVALAISGVTLAAPPDPGGEPESVLQEVVVTAQFRQENLQQTPLAVTAVNAEMMEMRSYTKVSDITAQAPNVVLRPNPSGFGNSMSAYIRGVGQGDLDPAVDPGVGIYIDDVYYASLTGSIFDLLDLDRVEILRGPQGTLSGMNSLGGAVKLYSRKPSGEGGFLEVTGGSLSRTDVRGSGDFTLVPDKVFVRISGVARHHAGYVTRLDYACEHPNDPYVVSGAIPRLNETTDCKLGEQGDQSMVATRGALRWVVSDSAELNVIADWTRDNSKTQASTLLDVQPLPAVFPNPLNYQGVPYDTRFVPYGPHRGDTVVNNPYVNYATFLDTGVTATAINSLGAPGTKNGSFYADPNDTLDAKGLSAQLNWKLTDKLALTSITGYRSYTSLNASDNDNSPVVILQDVGKLTHSQFSQELRLNGSVGKAVDYTVGGIYLRQKTYYLAREDLPVAPTTCYILFLVAGVPTCAPPALPTYQFFQNDPTAVTTQAAFLHSVWHFTDRLNLIGGIRYTKEKKDYTYTRLNPDGITPFLPLSSPADPLNGSVGVFDGSHIDYRASAEYQLTPDIMTYVQFSTGFKGGGVTPRPYFPEQVISFKPETLDAYEYGLKTQFFEHRLQANVAVFYNKYKDYQGGSNLCVDQQGVLLPTAVATPCGEYLNIANANIKGAELELQVRPVDRMLIDASYSYLDFKFGPPLIQGLPSIQGSSAPGIGKVKWAVGAQYELPLGQGSITPRVDVSATPKACGDTACDSETMNDAYTLANARLTYRSPSREWSAALEVTNLTDKLYYYSKVYLGAGYVDGMPGMPREWAITLRRNF